MVGKIIRFVLVSALTGLLYAKFRPWLWPAGMICGLMVINLQKTFAVFDAIIRGCRQATPPTVQWLCEPHPILALYAIGAFSNVAILKLVMPSDVWHRIRVDSTFDGRFTQAFALFVISFITFYILSFVAYVGGSARHDFEACDFNSDEWMKERIEYAQLVMWLFRGIGEVYLVIARAIVAIIGFFFSAWITTVFRSVLVIAPSFIGQIAAEAVGYLHSGKRQTIIGYAVLGYILSRAYVVHHHLMIPISNKEIISVIGMLSGVILALIVQHVFCRPLFKRNASA